MAETSPEIALPSAARDGQAETIAFLSRPGAYPSRPAAVERLETHGALVFLAGGEALKIKRAVKFSYMDFSTLEKRRRALVRELEINQPHATEIYVGVVPITREAGSGLAIGGEGEPVEWALRMRRFDQSDLLSARASHGALDATLCKALADQIIEFHRAAPVARGADSPGQMRAIAAEIADTLSAAPPAVAASDVEKFRAGAARAIERATTLLYKRAGAGCVRRCHGDLHLGNIVLWKGTPVLFDAIEFDERLATIDTLYDLAFLLMDLDYRGQRAAANAVLNRYLWRSGSKLDLDGLAALPLFLALRAGVRAMVARQRAAQQAVSMAHSGAHSLLDQSRAYLAAAIRHLAPAPPLLVAIGGLSGTGKSTLGAALAPDLGASPGAIHLRSDLERKALFGAAETDRLPPEAYTRDAGLQVYAALMDKASAALGAGHAVIADAVFARADERAAIEGIARRLGASFAGLWLEAPAGTLKSRVDARRGDASDATRDVVEAQLGYDLGPIAWTRINAGAGPEVTLASARDRLAD